MSYVMATPEIIAATAADLQAVGSTLDEAHRAATPTTLAVIPAAADEVSAGIGRLFSQYGREFQALAGKAAAFQQQFVHNLLAGGAAYASAEDAIVALLEGLRTGVESIRHALLDPLFNLYGDFVQGLINARADQSLIIFAAFIVYPLIFLPLDSPFFLFEIIIDKIIGLLS